MITFRKAKHEDILLIMKFIDEEWKKGHILAKNRDFFEWQFVDGENVRVLLAIDDENNKIYGMDGYIQYNDESEPDITGCMWKVIKSDIPLLGKEISNQVGEIVKPRYSVGIGLNRRAQKMERLLGNFVDKMNHFYFLSEKNEYNIAVIKAFEKKAVKDTKAHFEEVESIDLFERIISDELLKQYIPYKNYNYIQHRFFEHYSYSYKLLDLVIDDEKVPCIFVVREVLQNGTKILKIVDFFGKEEYIEKSGIAFEKLVKQKQYEYIDFYNYGIDKKYILKAGFSLLDEQDENIIPNYFEPFEQKNVEVYVSGDILKQKNTRMFIADGDQDRPSK